MEKKALNDTKYAYRFIYPALGYLILVMIVPLGFSIVVSFFKWDLIGDIEKKYIGLRNYAKLFQDPEVLKSFATSFKFIFFTVTVELVLGFCIASFLNRSFRFNRLVRIIVLLPMMLSPTVIALTWKLILLPDRGILNYLLSVFFGPEAAQVWLGKDFAFLSLVVVEVWLNTPFAALMILAGLQSIPTDVMDAAAVDGTNVFQRTFMIIIPLIKTVLLVALIFRTTFALRSFPLPWVLTGGGPAHLTNVIGIEIYRQAFSYYHIGYSSALSWILVIITFVLGVFYTRITLGKEGEK